MKKKLISMLIVAVMFVSLFGAVPAFAAGSAVVTFSGPTTVAPGQTYTYTYTLKVTSACAANANIAVGGAFEKVSGGDNLFYDSIPKNTTGSVNGTVTVKVKANAAMGSAGTISVLTDESKCSELVFDSSGKATGDPLITTVTGSISAQVGPGTPSAPSVSSVGYDSLLVKWTAMAGVGGYEVWRATSSGGTYSRITTTTSTSYTNTGLTTNTTYYYKVKAYYKASSSTLFGSLSGYASAAPVPAAPGNVKAASASYSSIKVTWGSVAGANGYKLYRATSANGTYSLVTTTSSASYTNTGLTTGTTYYYKVRAYRKVGTKYVEGAWSAAASAAPVLNNVAGTKAASYSYSSVKISWSKVSGASGYQVLRSSSANGKYTEIKKTTSSYYTNTGLATGTKYFYMVRAYRKVGTKYIYSNYSPVVSAAPALNGVSGAKASRRSSSSIKVSWKSVSGRSGYEVQRSTSKTGTYTVVKTTTSTSYTNTGLKKGTTYYYKIVAYRTVGGKKIYGGFSAIVSAKP